VSQKVADANDLPRPTVVAYAWEPVFTAASRCAPSPPPRSTTSMTLESDEGAWRAVAAAQTHGASVIATGTRGLGAARSALLGTVS
jgi:hypothetical protein